MNDNLGIRGALDVYVKNIKTGKCTHMQENNIIVDNALLQIMKLITSANMQGSITQIGFGSNGTAPSYSDTQLQNLYKKNINGFVIGADNKSVNISFSLGASENNGATIREFGLICLDNSLFARRLANEVIEKDESIIIEGTWTIKLEHII